MASRTLTVALRALVAGYTGPMKVAAAATGPLEASLFRVQRAGAGLATVGASLNRRVSLPLAALGAAAVHSALNFESAFAGVIKTVDGTEAQLAKLRQGILDMAKELPASREEIAGVAAAAGQLGIQTDNILGFTRVMIDLGESTNLSAEEAATALARLANITQMPQDEFDQLGSTVVALGNNLATTEAEIVEMGLRIAGAGATVGLTEAQILSFAGALSSVGIEAEAGGTALSRVMVNIASAVAKGGREVEGFAKVAGVSGEEFRAAFEDDAAGAIVMFIEGLGRMQASGQNVFGVLEQLGLGEIRVRDALLRAAGAGDLFTDSLKLGSRAWEENIALTEEAEQRYATTESQLKIAFNRITDALRQIGEVIAPIVADLANFAAVAAEAFAALPDPVKNFVLALGGIALVTPPLLSIAGGLAKAYGRVAGAMINAIVPAGTLSGKLAGHVATFDAVGASATTAAVGTSRFALALNGLTKATFVIGGLIALREILGTIDDQVDEINVGAAANELRDLAETGKFAGETLRRVFENFPGGDPVAMRQAADDLNKLDDALAELATRDPRAAAEAFDLISGRLNDLGASAGQIKDKFDDYAAVVEESGDASSDATGGVDDLAGSFDEQAGATEEATSALEDFSDALKAQFDPLFGMVDALEGQKQAMQDLRDRERELQELQASGTATTEELQAAEEALSGARTTAAKSVVDLQVASNDLKNEMLNGGLTAEDTRAKFIDMALTMGFTEGEAKAMADMFGFATGKAKELGRQEANPTVKAVGVDGTLREFERVRGRLVDLDGRTASILIQTTHRTIFEEQRRGFTTSGPQLRRQHGGPVFAGDLALVGEAGPEVGVFSRSGQVLSHADSMRAAATAMSVGGGSGGGRMVIDFRVSGDDDFLNREIHRRFRAGRIQLSVNGQRVQVA